MKFRSKFLFIVGKSCSTAIYLNPEIQYFMQYSSLSMNRHPHQGIRMIFGMVSYLSTVILYNSIFHPHWVGLLLPIQKAHPTFRDIPNPTESQSAFSHSQTPPQFFRYLLALIFQLGPLLRILTCHPYLPSRQDLLLTTPIPFISLMHLL